MVSRSAFMGWLFAMSCFFATACEDKKSGNGVSKVADLGTQEAGGMDTLANDAMQYIVVNRDIRMKWYFHFMDSVIQQYDSLVAYALTEHLLVRANPWIIDTLASYDYDVRKLKGEFIKDQREAIMLRKGDTLWIPNDSAAAYLMDLFHYTVLDVNIPEFKLRIIEDGKAKYIFPVRVGRDEIKFLAMAGREVSLRTPIGEGEIVRVEKDPWYMNPVDGERYFATHRDDGKLTELPRIPFLEPSINGQRPGTMIHPTTNPRTLGKAYSNGCIGTPEGAAWYIYYHAPIGTKVRFRYDLKVLDDCGDTLYLKNVYHLKLPVNLSASVQPVYCWRDTLADGTLVHRCE